jgi:hypothetical protein
MMSGRRSDGRGMYQEFYLQDFSGKHWALDVPDSLSQDMTLAVGSNVELSVAGPRSTVQDKPLILPSEYGHQRRKLLATGSAPTGDIRILVYIMDLSQREAPCQQFPPATTPQVCVFVGPPALEVLTSNHSIYNQSSSCLDSTLTALKF